MFEIKAIIRPQRLERSPHERENGECCIGRFPSDHLTRILPVASWSGSRVYSWPR